MKSLAFAALTLFAVVALVGQTGSSVINGTVRDPSGAPIPGVTITAAEVSTGKATTVVTNENGLYTLSNLPVGTYQISASLPGFVTQQSYLRFAGSSPLQQDFSLRVQAPPAPSPFFRPASVEIVADRQSRQGAVTAYRGNVRMTTDSLVLRADELDFNSQTQRADVRGNVSVQVREIGPRLIPLGNGN